MTFTFDIFTKYIASFHTQYTHIYINIMVYAKTSTTYANKRQFLRIPTANRKKISYIKNDAIINKTPSQVIEYEKL